MKGGLPIQRASGFRRARSRGIAPNCDGMRCRTRPNFGNTRAGFMAERFCPARSIVSGGLVCVFGVRAAAAGALALPEVGRERGLDSSG